MICHLGSLEGSPVWFRLEAVQERLAYFTANQKDAKAECGPADGVEKPRRKASASFESP
jgi:hypothetical protein